MPIFKVHVMTRDSTVDVMAYDALEAEALVQEIFEHNGLPCEVSWVEEMEDKGARTSSLS